MKKSTIDTFKKHGWRIDRAIHNYYYFLFYKPYISAAYYLTVLLTKYFSWLKPISIFAKAVFNRYHSKVLSYSDTKKILSLNKDLRHISDENKKIVPFKHATKIIFQEPEYIAVIDCPCKKTLKADAEDINSCIAVGKNLATFWLEHRPAYNPRKITQQEALEIIKRLRKKGHITQAFFKVATGGSTGVICNCHPDTCVSLQATKLSKRINPSLTMNAESGYSVSIDINKCDLNGKCTESCHYDAITIKNGQWKYDSEACMGCGLCVENCPNKALTLYNDKNKISPLDVEEIKKMEVQKK